LIIIEYYWLFYGQTPHSIFLKEDSSL